MAGPPLALAVLGHGVVDASRPWLHADDEAVLRGRAAFETLRVYGGHAFRLDDHLDRLARSAAVLELPGPDVPAMARLAVAAVSVAGRPDAVLRVVWTAGRDGEGRGNGFALVTSLPDGLERQRERGIAVASLQLAIGAHARTASPWLLPGVKSTSYAVNMAAQREARRRGADDAVFLSLEGLVLEGPVSNVWFREGETLFTPSLELGILAGVTRATLLADAAARGVEVVEGEFPIERMAAADEVFTSSSVREVMPVVRLDGATVGDGSPGPAALAAQAGLRGAARADGAPAA